MEVHQNGKQCGRPAVNRTISRGFLGRLIFVSAYIDRMFVCDMLCCFSHNSQLTLNILFSYTTPFAETTCRVTCTATSKYGTFTARYLTPTTPTGCHDLPCAVMQRAMSRVLKSTGGCDLHASIARQHYLTPATPSGCHFPCRFGMPLVRKKQLVFLNKGNSGIGYWSNAHAVNRVLRLATPYHHVPECREP